MRYATALAFTLLALLAGCGATYAERPHTWRGEAFGRSYRGACVRGLAVRGQAVAGAWVWPDQVLLEAEYCRGNGHTLAVLAHEVAHLVACGASEACATRQGSAWIRAGVTLQELGWEQPAISATRP